MFSPEEGLVFVSAVLMILRQMLLLGRQTGVSDVLSSRLVHIRLWTFIFVERTGSRVSLGILLTSVKNCVKRNILFPNKN